MVTEASEKVATPAASDSQPAVSQVKADTAEAIVQEVTAAEGEVVDTVEGARE